MVGDVGVSDDLEDGLDGGSEAGEVDGAVGEIFLKVGDDGFSNVASEPPAFVAGLGGGPGEAAGEPGGFEGDNLTVVEADEGKVVLESDHAVKRSGWSGVLKLRCSKDWISSMKSPISWNSR